MKASPSVADLEAMLERQKLLVASLPFDSEIYLCSEEELLESDRQQGETMALNAIEAAKKLYPASPRKQAKELRWWCEFACAFPASSVHELPLLIAAIRELEQ